MKRHDLIAVAGALVLIFTGCSAPTPPANPAPTSTSAATTDNAAFLTAHGLDGMDGKQMVDHLDRVPVTERQKSLMASVRVNELLLADGEQQVTVPLEGNEFYLSLAPYVTRTHDCFYHSLTTCLGEMNNKSIHVRITDKAGKTLVDQQVTTFDNGFAGFWLPRNIEGTVEVTADGRTGSSEFSTDEKGATCLTTIELKA